MATQILEQHTCENLAVLPECRNSHGFDVTHVQVVADKRPFFRVGFRFQLAFLGAHRASKWLRQDVAVIAAAENGGTIKRGVALPHLVRVDRPCRTHSAVWSLPYSTRLTPQQQLLSTRHGNLLISPTASLLPSIIIHRFAVSLRPIGKNVSLPFARLL